MVSIGEDEVLVFGEINEALQVLGLDLEDQLSQVLPVLELVAFFELIEVHLAHATLLGSLWYSLGSSNSRGSSSSGRFYLGGRNSWCCICDNMGWCVGDATRGRKILVVLRVENGIISEESIVVILPVVLDSAGPRDVVIVALVLVVGSLADQVLHHVVVWSDVVPDELLLEDKAVLANEHRTNLLT